MATNIYVGNLPWSTTTDDLYAMFQQYGAVTRAQVVTDRETGRSRGFGFVEMANEAEAKAAIAALNNQPMNGRPLTVNVAKPREGGGGGGGGYGGGGGGGGAAARWWWRRWRRWRRWRWRLRWWIRRRLRRRGGGGDRY